MEIKVGIPEQMKLCFITIFILFPVQKSTGYSILASPRISPTFSLSEDSVPSINYDRISPTSSPSQPSGSVLQPPMLFQPHESADVPQPFQETVLSIPPSSQAVVSSHKSAPGPQVREQTSSPIKSVAVSPVIHGIVPSMSRSPPLPVPPPKSRVAPGIVPSTPPSAPVVVPSHKSVPTPQIGSGIEPAMPPTPPLIVPSNKSPPVPSNKSAPVPSDNRGIEPATPPSPPVIVPSNKSASVTPVDQGVVPSLPPRLPVVAPSHKPTPVPQVDHGIVPSVSPSSPVIVPSNGSAPVPQVIPRIIPATPPSLSMVLPPNRSKSVAPVDQGIVPSIPPSSPVVVPSNRSKSVPPAPVDQGIVPSIAPSQPVVPSNKSSTVPSSQGIVPSASPTPVRLTPNESAPTPQVIPRIVPSVSPVPPLVLPSNKSGPVPQVVQGIVPSMPPNSRRIVPSHELAPSPRVLPRIVPSIAPSDPSQRGTTKRIPIKMPLAPAPFESPPKKIPPKSPIIHASTPKIAPSMVPGRDSSPTLPPPFTATHKRHGIPSAASPTPAHSPPINHTSKNTSSPTPAPSKLSKPVERNWLHSPASSPIHSFDKYHHSRKRASSPEPAPSRTFPPPMSHNQGPVIPPTTSHSPAVHPKRRSNQYPASSIHAPSVATVEPPFPSTVRHHLPVSPPSTLLAPGVPLHRHVLPPTSSRKPKSPSPPPITALPPPPPNQDCTAVTCIQPLTNSPPGSPCACVLPMQVGLRLGVALYTFFPLVSELAEELAAGVFMKLSQVRIMGANADGQQLDNTVVLIDLVPLGVRFDYTTAFLAYQRFWHKQVSIKASFFGDYEVLYVHYPGLPPSPPSSASSITTIDGVPYPGHGSNGRTIQPLGVDVRKKRHGGLGGSMIAIIVLSSSIAVALCIIGAWLLVLKCFRRVPASTPLPLTSLSKPSAGTAGSMMFGSGPSSAASMSFGSSITTYAGSARTYSAREIEKATDNFHSSRILGEGGFGRVYKGIQDDGTLVAVKVLKRDDQQGGREFLAEVEMLSRLHHRNLVKLLGICIEENARCLVYELIPNGSVESHLHGPDKDTAPLDWGARIKIALGAARGLAYLHEDSSPHVIHRDFKCSNILLEHDFTPKVADFGLARTALEEGDQQITTRVMGTFGYVAPEYAMTGHLLVKSDVYSYGVVLLELLTGRKPVDMTQPEGQENLVTWARPYLTSKEGLEMIIDPSLGANFPFDSVAKVAAIASMCVQPEVSHRPFMGEVVQALKLVCNECDETKETGGSESCGQEQEDLSGVDIDTRTSTDSGHLPESSRTRYSLREYNSSREAGRELSASDVFSTSSRIDRQESGSFRRYSSSGPLRTGRTREFWQRIRDLSRGSVSEHGTDFRF